MSVFAITDINSGNIIARVEAPNRRTALAYGRQLIEARELSSKEIVDAVQAGLSITDVPVTAGAQASGTSEEQ